MKGKNFKLVEFKLTEGIAKQQYQIFGSVSEVHLYQGDKITSNKIRNREFDLYLKDSVRLSSTFVGNTAKLGNRSGAASHLAKRNP